MTEDKARKTATRQRMAETGEPYSVARHAVEREQAEADVDAAVEDRALEDRAVEDSAIRDGASEADAIRDGAARPRNKPARRRTPGNLAADRGTGPARPITTGDAGTAPSQSRRCPRNRRSAWGARKRTGSLPTGCRTGSARSSQRFEEFRERAEEMVSQVERIFNLARDQAPDPGQAPRPPEPPEQPRPAGSAGSD